MTVDEFSHEIPVRKGAHQGNTLSPTLFNICINDILGYMTEYDSPFIDRN